MSNHKNPIQSNPALLARLDSLATPQAPSSHRVKMRRASSDVADFCDMRSTPGRAPALASFRSDKTVTPRAVRRDLQASFDLEERKMLDIMRHRFEAISDPEDKELYNDYKHYLHDGMLKRFLVAMKMNPDEAFTKLLAHIKWRREFGADTTWMEDHSDFEARREIYWGGNDKLGQPTLIFRFRKHDEKQPSTEYAKLLVHVLEKGRKVKHFDKMNIIFDVGGASRAQFSVDLVKTLVGTLQHNYPERVYAIHVFPVSMLERMILNIVKQFMDPNTAQKMKLYSSSDYKAKLTNYFELEQLEATEGGTSPDFQPLDMPEPMTPEEIKAQRQNIRRKVKDKIAKFRKEYERDPDPHEAKKLCRKLFLKAARLEREMKMQAVSVAGAG